MVWMSDETLKLYREMNASLLAIKEDVADIRREQRRLERRMDTMARTTQESLDAVRETRGFVASLATLIAELRDKITSVTSGALSPDDQAKVDAIFDEAHAASSAAAAALIQNPKPTDSTTQPAPTPPPAPEPQP